MTQIIGLMTKNHVMLASDRLLTWDGGPKDGEVYKDEECKLVNICNRVGVGYTGKARVNGVVPTHEWLAVTFAKAACGRSYEAVEALMKSAPAAAKNEIGESKVMTFVFVGWDLFGDSPALRPHFIIVSNVFDASGQPLSRPNPTFSSHLRHLSANEDFVWHSIGQRIPADRAAALDRNLRRLVEREIGPQAALRYLVEEIQETSRHQYRVGDRILTMSIPRASVEHQLRTGMSSMVASTANLQQATFGYFDPAMNEFRQFGPTFVCGRSAFTDVVGESDPTKDFVSSSMRVLHK